MAEVTCSVDSDCPAPGAPCTQCSNGSFVCPSVSCVVGKCVYEFPTCHNACAAGLEWCPLNGRCVQPACLACCQFGTACSADIDCGTRCVACGNGTPACSTGQCGTSQAGQCFYPEPF